MAQKGTLLSWKKQRPWNLIAIPVVLTKEFPKTILQNLNRC